MDRLALSIVFLNTLLALPAAAAFTETQRLHSIDSNSGDGVGSAVEVSGDVGVLCSPSHDTGGTYAGECLLYRLDNGTWESNGILRPGVPVFNGDFGFSVAKSGDRIVVGAPARAGDVRTDDPGRAYVFRRTGIDSWTEEAMLLPVMGEDNDVFGDAVAIDGDVIAVGAWGDDDVAFNSGAVYVFRHNGSAWLLEEKLLPSPSSTSLDPSVRMGESVAIHGDLLVAGSRRALRFFERETHGWQQTQLESGRFANSLALQGTLLAAATLGEMGKVALYEKTGRRWEFLQRLTPAGVPGGSENSVALAGSLLVVGSGDAGTYGNHTGAAYVFRATAGSWVQGETLGGSLSVNGDTFGRSIATDGTHILVGAPHADEGGILSTGEAYVFAEDRGNALPAADAGLDATLECTGPAGATVMLDGSGSSDADSTPGTNDGLVFFEWLEGATLLGTGEILQGVLPLGSHAITLRVIDGRGAQDEDTVVVDIVDTLPPSLTVTLSPALLWPPNHRLVDVSAIVQVTGVCGPSMVTLLSLTSDEPDDAAGGADGNTQGDVQDAATGTDDRTFRLRAERTSGGSGRTYTATYRVEETGVGSASASGTASVPPDQNGTADPISLTVIETPHGTRVDWTPVLGDPAYHVIQARLQDLVATEEAYALETVQCLEPASLDTSTAGFEHAEVPLPGQVFVYAVEYADVSYGDVSAAKPRTVLAGDCP